MLPASGCSIKEMLMKKLAVGLIVLLFFLPVWAERNVLIFSGGWNGHKPHETAAYMKALLEAQGFSVTCSDSLSCLDDAEALRQYELIVPNWTMGKISGLQVKNLSDAVAAGAGLAGIHGGMGDAFRKTPVYERMVGGHFVTHPHVGPYTMDAVAADHPVMQGVPVSFEYCSEQYFMKMDDDVTVLADSDYSSEEPSLRMPTVWVKQHGQGRVFYSALGHNVMNEYETFPAAKTIFINGCLWAAKNEKE